MNHLQHYWETTIGNLVMKINISATKQELGQKAAKQGAALIREAIRNRGEANIILATGASQFEMLAELTRQKIDWSNVTCFHLDEYINLPPTHPASFRKYLKERFAGKVTVKAFHYIDGQAAIDAECLRLHNLIQEHPIDVAFIGIGENAHLAFNDPPADFDTDRAYIQVSLDDACRLQQFNEGWFTSLNQVPQMAISMSIRQILRSAAIICTVPDQRKAKAVKASLGEDITPMTPASILQDHQNVYLYLDRESASLL